MKDFLTSLRLLLTTVVICSAAYPALLLLFGGVAAPHKAQGSLIVGPNGQVLGSAAVAQSFTRAEYFWPRPSAVAYDASAAGGSNLSPANPLLRERATEILDRLELPAGVDAPPDLLAASGSGIDPHITLDAALLQAPRVAAARGMDESSVRELIQQEAFTLTSVGLGDQIVNVLELNLALDSLR